MIVGFVLGLFASATFGITLFVAFFADIGLYFILKKKVIGDIAIKYGFGEQDISNYGLGEYVYDLEKNNENFDNKSEKKVKEFFSNIMFYIGPIQCAIKSKESMNQILDLIGQLCNKKEEDWNTFKVEKI